jgi:hypothetical protein
MSDQAKDYDLNHGVQIILSRMKTNPEEFFDEGGRWRWIFKDTLREVLTEIEKAAIFEGLKEVRRMEISAKAAATVLRAEENEKEQIEKEKYYYNAAVPQAEGTSILGSNQNTNRVIHKGSGFF